MRTRLRELQEEFLTYRRSVDPSSQLELESFINTRKRSRTESSTSNTVTPASQPTVSNDPPATKRKRNDDDRRSSTPAPSTLAPTLSEARRTATRGYSTLPPDYAPPPPQPTFVYSPTSTSTSSRPSLVMSPGVSENSSGAEPLSLGMSLHLSSLHKCPVLKHFRCHLFTYGYNNARLWLRS